MDFCPQCGSLLAPKTVASGSQSMVILTCKKCGYKSTDKIGDSRVVMKTFEHSPKQMVAVIDKENQLSVEPTIRMECPKCGNNTAYVWLVQTRGTDESSTQFLRCTNCGYTYREVT